MITHKSIWVDEGENGLRIDDADCDGFQIVETAEGKICNSIYVYFSEAGKLIDALREKLNEHNNK